MVKYTHQAHKPNHFIFDKLSDADRIDAVYVNDEETKAYEVSGNELIFDEDLAVDSIIRVDLAFKVKEF